MTISFKLEPVPNWMPDDDRFCRACDKRTEWVVVAKRTSYTYPCCNSESCQNAVHKKITNDLQRSKAHA